MSKLMALCAVWNSSILCRFALTSFLLFAGMGLALGWMLGRTLERFYLNSMTEEVAKTLSPRVARHLEDIGDLGPLRGGGLVYFDRFVRDSVITSDTVSVKLWDREGQIVYATDRSLIGKKFQGNQALSKALSGSVARSMTAHDGEEYELERQYGRLIEVYAPVYLRGEARPAGAFEVYRLYEPIHQDILKQQRYLYGVLTLGLLTVYGSLFWIVKEGSSTISKQRAEIERQYNQLQEAYAATMETLSTSLEIRHGDTEDHVERTSELATAIGRAMGLSGEALSVLEQGACLHDVGKIGVPDAVLLKPGRLTEEEWTLMRKHPEMGHKLICQVPGLDRVAEVVLSHHERYDGTGYPRGLKADEIPVEARILAVMDAYDAMTNDRPYRKAMTPEAAISELEANSGSHFDPQVVRAFVKVVWPEMEPARGALLEAIAKVA